MIDDWMAFWKFCLIASLSRPEMTVAPAKSHNPTRLLRRVTAIGAAGVVLLAHVSDFSRVA